jgi:hypothetical protein
MEAALAPLDDTLPQAAEDHRLSYRGALGQESVCRIRLYRPQGKPVVIVATELRENQGISITNAPEVVHPLAWERAGRPFSVLFVEHYPGDFYGGRRNDPTDRERFSLVTFTDAKAFQGVWWQHLTHDEMQALIGKEDALHERAYEAKRHEW